MTRRLATLATLLAVATSPVRAEEQPAPAVPARISGALALLLVEPEPFVWAPPRPGMDLPDLRLFPADVDAPEPPAEARPSRMLAFGGLLFSVQLATLVAFPPANWSAGGMPRTEQFRSAFSAPPVWNDGDPWTTNYVLHPLMGSLLYTAARRSNYGPLGSFLFATAGSTVWEYGIESWFEQPSWPDLLVTSTAGALIGEARWWARQRILSGGRPGFLGQLGLLVADPIAEFQLIFQKVAGRKVAREFFGDELL